MVSHPKQCSLNAELLDNFQCFFLQKKDPIICNLVLLSCILYRILFYSILFGSMMFYYSSGPILHYRNM